MTKREIPAPLYAAAGAGDLAYQGLRKLPDAAARTLRSATETAQELRHRVTEAPAVDLPRLRKSAQRNAAAVIAGAVTAQEKAIAGYRSLVERGERVVAEAARPIGEPVRVRAEQPADVAVVPVTTEGKQPVKRAVKTTGRRGAATK